MTEEKEEVESSEEDEQDDSKKDDSEESSEEEGTSEEKEDFEKEKEFVPANKFNQAQRKLREAELEKRELEKKLQEKSETSPTAKAPAEKKDDEEESFFGDEEEKEEKKETPDFSALVDEKVKPVLDAIKKREEEDHKKDRTAFFEAHPEYRENGEKWSGLLDTMDKYINPNSGESYYEQLNAAHILHTGQDMGNTEVADKKKEMAGDAASSGTGAQKAGAKEEFTQEDRQIMKDFGVSEEGMRSAKKKIESGQMQILG